MWKINRNRLKKEKNPINAHKMKIYHFPSYAFIYTFDVRWEYKDSNSIKIDAKILWISSTVPQHGVSVHANIQSHLHDAADWALEWMSSVPRADASGLSIQLLGGHKWATGNQIPRHMPPRCHSDVEIWNLRRHILRPKFLGVFPTTTTEGITIA